MASNESDRVFGVSPERSGISVEKTIVGYFLKFPDML